MLKAEGWMLSRESRICAFLVLMLRSESAELAAGKSEKEKTRPAQGLSGRIVGLLYKVPDGSVGLLVVSLLPPEQGNLRVGLPLAPTRTLVIRDPAARSLDIRGRAPRSVLIAPGRSLSPRVRTRDPGAPCS